MYRRLAVLLLLLLSACEACATVKPAQEPERCVEVEPEPPYVFFNPVPFNPPQEYKKWYVELSLCTETVGFPFGVIRWFVADSIKRRVPLPDSVKTIPAYLAGVHWRGSIYIKKGHELNEQLIRHEIAHAQGFTHWHGALWRCELPQPSAANG
jgi:hypothetical protein